MEKPILHNQDEYPDDAVLSRTLGNVKEVWDSFLEYIEREHPDFSQEWRYYKDGYAWLYKVMKKKKTICWVSVWDKMFKTTFYFPDRAEEVIKAGELDPIHVEKFVNGKHYGKTRGLTIDISSAADLDAIQILIKIKEKLK